jgi:hypothetical protein
MKKLKKFREHGHSIGVQGFTRTAAVEAIVQKGAERYFADDVLPQLDRMRVAWIPVSSFAYPDGRFSVESDTLFKAKGFAHVRGAEANLDGATFPVSELGSRFRLNTFVAGTACPTDIADILKRIRRCAERSEVFVLTLRGVDMKTGGLERILATAKECGVAIIGFDELP